MIKTAFPGMPYKINKSDWFIELVNGSRIWIGGTDDKERTEKILGNEYSTIYFNEASQISFDSVSMIWTRLAETSALKRNLFLYDANPPASSHWTHDLFVKHINPISGEKIDPEKFVKLLMNPKDNLENLPPQYIEILESLSERDRNRFLHGLFQDDVDGALWNLQLLEKTRIDPLDAPENYRRVLVAVDPSVSTKETSDECGIVVGGLGFDGHGYVLEDVSGRMSPVEWGRAAVNAYYRHEADAIVIEVNQGGDMCKNTIKNIDRNIKVIMVRASKGKYARAEPISAIYEEDRIHHVGRLSQLEEELKTYVPGDTASSPNRLDALVWLMYALMINKKRGPLLIT